MLPALLALSLFGASPFSGLGTVPAEIEADRLSVDEKLALYLAEGNVVLRRAGLTVYADRLSYQQQLGTVIAEGHVVAVEGKSVLSCERVILMVPGLEGAMEHAEIRLKTRVPRGESGAEVLADGEDRMRLSAEGLKRTGPRSFELSGGSFTPCRCAEGSAPDWKLTAHWAEVDVDSGALLVAPVFHIKDVPVLILPAFYVPLGARRSGLLIPTGGYSSPTGVKLGLPLYLTFGRSYDATINADFWFSRGPSPRLELRAAPTEDLSAELDLRLLLDGGKASGGGYQLSGETWQPRFAAGGSLRQKSQDGLNLGVELNLVGDPGYAAEFGAEFLSRQVEESVSRALLRWPTPPQLSAVLGLALRQDLRNRRYAASGRSLREISLFSGDPGPGDVRYRVADLRLDAYVLSELGLVGGARLIASAFVATSDRVGRFGRVDFRPELALPIHGGRFFTLTPAVALRLTGWGGAGSGEASSSGGRIAPILRTSLQTELYARGEGLSHLLRPKLEHLLIPALAGAVPRGFDAADEIDRLSAVHQISASVENVLWLKGASAPLLDLVVSLGDDLGAPGASMPAVGGMNPPPGANATLNAAGVGLSELSVRLSLSAPLDAPWSLGAEGVWIQGLGARTSRGLFAVARAAHAGTLSASFSFVDGDGPIPRAFFAAPEELVPGASAPVDRYRAAVLDSELGALPWSTYRAFSSSLSIDVLAPLRLAAGVGVDLISSGLPTPSLRYLSGTMSYRSPCECWSASVSVVQSRDRATPDVHVLFDLAQLGGTGF